MAGACIYDEGIFNGLVSIFKKRAGIDFSSKVKLREKNVLGVEVQMHARELLLALYDIENFFEIKISEQYLVNEMFNSFDNIYEIVEEVRDSIDF